MIEKYSRPANANLLHFYFILGDRQILLLPQEMLPLSRPVQVADMEAWFYIFIVQPEEDHRHRDERDDVRHKGYCLR